MAQTKVVLDCRSLGGGVRTDPLLVWGSLGSGAVIPLDCSPSLWLRLSPAVQVQWKVRCWACSNHGHDLSEYNSVGEGCG